jgi:UDP-sugar diphosphatase
MSTPPTITNWQEEEVPDTSPFVKPRRLKFEYNGKPRIWDSCLTYDDVCCVIYHKTEHALIFVQQFRPPVYKLMMDDESKSSNPYAGFTHELCAGICDKKTKSLAETMQEEVAEESGFKAPLDSFEKVGTFRNAVGILGYLSTMYYVEVDDSMKVSDGGGLGTEGEDIQLVYIPIHELQNYLFDDTFAKDSVLQMGILWALKNKFPNPLAFQL